MEIVPGVHQIKLPLATSPLEHINVYLVEGSEGNLLIDTGWNTPESFSTLRDELRGSGFGFKDISHIVITHIHADHYGLAGKLTQLCGAELYLHQTEAELIDSRYVSTENSLEEMERHLHRNGVPQNELPLLTKASMWMRQFVGVALPKIRLSGGETISLGSFELEVLWTPGHSPGHICLYEPKRKLLFSGDHILPEITPFIGLHPQSTENPLGDFINSLKSLEKLKANFVFPGHGPVFSGLGQKIWEILHHHEERKAAILRVIRDELKTAYQIAERIPWMPDQGGVTFQDLNPWDKRFAVLETLAHLQLLLVEGKVEKVIENDIVFYWGGG